MLGFRFSPFSWLFETQEYPHARTLRSSLPHKFKDSFFVATGKINDKNNTIVTGLFDYVTGFIPFALLGVLLWSLFNIKTIPGKIVFVPALLLNIPLLLCRVLFGAAVMLGFSLITLAVHGISCIVAKKTFDTALTYSEEISESGEQESLTAFLEKNHCGLDDLTASQTADLIVLLDSNSRQSLRLRASSGLGASLESSYHALFVLNVGEIQSKKERDQAAVARQTANIRY